MRGLDPASQRLLTIIGILLAVHAFAALVIVALEAIF